jgi:cobalt-zinc-cadmium efflux system outer membrane protein
VIQEGIFVLSLWVLAQTGPPPVAPASMTEAQAVQEALASSPVLAQRRAEVEQAKGRETTARTYLYNPEITVEAADRESPGESFDDRNLALSQQLEISGARGKRIEQATAEVEAANARLLHETRLVTARVQTAFSEALRAREALEVERANTDLVAAMAEAARKGMELGAFTQIQTNVALSQLGRARRAFRQAEAEYAVARAVLAEVMGAGPPEGPVPEGALEVADAPGLALPDLLEAMRTRRADLDALRSGIRAAQARTLAARRERYPSPVLGAFRQREGPDTVTGLTLTVGIPLFNHNQGTIQEAAAGEQRAAAELRVAESELTRAGMESVARLAAAQGAAADLRSEVVGNLEDSLRLLLRSYEAGKIGLPEVLAFRRELVDAQREYLETVAGARLARIEMNLVMGSDTP